MYIPNVQSAIVAGMALTSTLSSRKRTISLPNYFLLTIHSIIRVKGQDP